MMESRAPVFIECVVYQASLKDPFYTPYGALVVEQPVDAKYV